MSIAEWEAWAAEARKREPVFLEAIDHHEHDLNLPGVDIILRTDPRHCPPPPRREHHFTPYTHTCIHCFQRDPNAPATDTLPED